jgi:hypothetical protein
MSEPSGILKEVYPDEEESELQKALRRKREKLKATMLGAEGEENG